MTTTYVYDALNRLTDVTNSAGSSYHYQLRADGKRLSVTDSSGTTAYTYDRDGHLTQESGPQGTIAYTYDIVGNRLTRTVSGFNSPGLANGTTTYSYDADDRLTSEAGPSGSPSFSYDANGNQLAVNGQVASYDWQNKLIGLGTAQNPTAAASYLYDADGDKVGEVSSAGTVYDLIDTSLSFPSMVEERDASGNLLASYAYGDDLLTMARGGQTYSYVYDGLGSTIALTNSSGSVTDSYAYDAFGEGLSHSGSSVNDFLFDGQQYDAPTADYDLRARFYDETSGRFLSQDPFGGSSQDPITLHRYLYAGDDPVDYEDPSGEAFTLNETLTSATIGAAIGSISTVVANNALGRAQTFSSIATGAAIGAVLGPLSAAYTGVAVASSLVGILSSGGLAADVFTNPASTPQQKFEATALLVASLFGAREAFKYQASDQINGLRSGTLALKYPLPLSAPQGIEMDSGQIGLRDKDVWQIPGIMDSLQNGRPVNPISYYRDGNKYVISEGNHRMTAALLLYRDSGDPQYVFQLLQQGKDDGPPPGGTTYRMLK